jgi:biopolymer transport protein ExbB
MRAMDYALAVLGGVGFVIAVERAIFLFRPSGRAGLFAVLDRGDREAALRWVAGQAHTPLMRLAQSALANPDEAELALDEALLRETPRLEARTAHVATVGNVACLAGVLGTVHTLISALAPSGTLSPADRGTILAAVMADSLGGTVMGLAVSLVMLVIYSVLTSRTQVVLAELQEASVRLKRFSK